MLKRIHVVIREASRTPVAGMDKPEPLKGNLKGWWSRRITGSHRCVHCVNGKGGQQTIEILQCRWHDE